MATVGFVALMGIEIKNSILLVDFTNQLRATGTSLDEAIEKAGEVRFLPILLTTLTAIGGLLPLALQGSGLYSPLAWVIIGGLISSHAAGTARHAGDVQAARAGHSPGSRRQRRRSHRHQA